MSEPVATFSMAQLKDALENIGLSSDPRDKTVSPVELWAALHEAGAEPAPGHAVAARQEAASELARDLLRKSGYTPEGKISAGHRRECCPTDAGTGHTATCPTLGTQAGGLNA
jgi:hypothetical protein